MVAGGYHEPERSPFGGDAYKYERDQDRFVGFCLGLAARAGAAPQPARAATPDAEAAGARAMETPAQATDYSA